MSPDGVDGRPSASIGTPAARYDGRRRHDVAARERRARRGQLVFGDRRASTIRAGPAEHRDRRREQTVVGPDEVSAFDLDRDAAPVGADAGIDDGEHHPVGQVLDRADEREGPGAHVERRGSRG